MLTPFGKFCRKLRIDKGELLKDMADKLGVTPSYLSAVERGKRNIPKDWFEKISNIYLLNQSQRDTLFDVIQKSNITLKVDLSMIDEYDRKKIYDILTKYDKAIL